MPLFFEILFHGKVLIQIHLQIVILLAGRLLGGEDVSRHYDNLSLDDP
jgi:hypothetical protein